MPATREFTCTLEVKIDGTKLTEDVESRMMTAYVDESTGQAAMFVLGFSDPDRNILALSKAKVGGRVVLSVVTPSSTAAQPLLHGEITALEATFDAFGTVTVIRGFDQVHRLHRGRLSGVYANMSYSDVARKVAGKAGLTVGTIDATSPVHPHVARNNCSDWQFLAGLADEIGYEVRVTDGKFNFRKPTRASTAPAKGTLDSTDDLALVPQEDFLRFRATVTSAEQVKSVSVRGWDAKAKKALVGTANAATTSAVTDITPAAMAAKFGNHTYVTGETPYDSQAEVDGVAKALADDIAAAAAELEGVAIGNPKLRAGTAISLGQAGDPFDGKYTLTSVRHNFDPETGYTTDFTASGRHIRSLHTLTDHDGGRRGSGPRIPGVVNGIVTDVKDPDKVGRVKVKLPHIADDYVTDWVRVAYAGVGNQYGLIFIPEVNDEVLVAFDRGDLRQPYVLGGLYNHQDKPLPAACAINAGDGKVDGRGIVTRVGHRILFNDKDGPGKGIEIKTGKDELQIVMDETKKTITVTSKGDVIVETQGNVTVKATKNFEVDAQQISLKAKQGVSVDAGGGAFNAKGSTASVEGQGQAELKGATTNVKGSGMVVVQGGIVKIN
jgi:phage protein D/phage baseplate assembly protein gpV